MKVIGRELACVAAPKDDITPGGKPETVRLIFPVKPFKGVTEITLFTLVPLGMLTAPGEKRVKFGTATIRVKVVVLLRVPDVPVTVTVDVPDVAELPAARVMEVPTALLAGLNVAVTPCGKPATTKLTLLL